ncbi:MAG: dTDP-4-dehydrorhamnose reductase [Chitinophagaceae bacterium]
MAKILVTGANGQLGMELRDLAVVNPQHSFHFATRAELDITNKVSVDKFFHQFLPDYCINCAAYTAVDKAQTDEVAASAINVLGVKNLAAASFIRHTKLIHISTDYVFDGGATIPYKEDDATNPIGVYGTTKWEGEQVAIQENPTTVIIRTSWVYSVYGNNFVKTMLRLMESRTEVNVVADQYGSPTYAADLAASIFYIIESSIWEPGIFHFSNEGSISWFDFATAIKEATQSRCIINPITTDQFPTQAKRPKYSVMDKSKIIKIYGLPIYNWKGSLNKCLSLFQNISK